MLLNFLNPFLVNRFWYTDNRAFCFSCLNLIYSRNNTCYGLSYTDIISKNTITLIAEHRNAFNLLFGHVEFLLPLVGVHAVNEKRNLFIIWVYARVKSCVPFIFNGVLLSFREFAQPLIEKSFCCFASCVLFLFRKHFGGFCVLWVSCSFSSYRNLIYIIPNILHCHSVRKL